jgi:peptidyl-dipeptidase Dcp
MLSVNAQGIGQPIAQKMDPIRWVPAFNEYNISQIKPAFDGIKERLSEIEANNPKAPTFENTIAQMERAGSDFKRVMTVWDLFFESKQLNLNQKWVRYWLLCRVRFIKKKLFKRIETFTILPIKGRATAVNLVELPNFVKEGDLNPEARRKWLKSMVN